MVNRDIIEQYIQQNRKLTPLNGKRPISPQWTTLSVPIDDIYSHRGNLGLVIDKKTLVIDVDPRNGGDDSYTLLARDLLNNDNTKLYRTVNTPSGGYHIYLRLDKRHQGIKLKKTLSKYKGIDFISLGGQVVIAGSVTDDIHYTWADDILELNDQIAPPYLVGLLAQGQNKTLNNDDNDDDDADAYLLSLDADKPTRAEVIAMLDYLDPSINNSEWVKIGMALYSWDRAKGLDLWESWSIEGDNYVQGETVRRWQSFSYGAVGMGTLVYMVNEAKKGDQSTVLNNYIEELKGLDITAINHGFITDIKKEQFNPINLEIINKKIQERTKELNGVTVGISQIRSMTKGKASDGDVMGHNEPPAWCNRWVYVVSLGCFINRDTLAHHKAQAFDITHGIDIPLNDTGGKQSATKYVADNGYVKVVNNAMYLPAVGVDIIELEGLEVLNTFNKKTIPNRTGEHTPDGLKAVDRVKKHIKLLCTTEKDTEILLCWLAWQVQHKGIKILWSPVIQSIQGVGKSFIGELLRACLGDINVSTVAPSQVVSDFNSWSVGSCVNILEELRVKGHNRYEATNALKPLITDRMIQINSKGTPQYMAYNTTNYICFTNEKDALPLDTDDRRFFVIFAPIKSLDHMQELTGTPTGEYFKELFNAIREYPQELNKWLLEYKITDYFKTLHQAPETAHKASMIATEHATHEGLTEIGELLKKGGEYFDIDVISSGDFFAVFEFEYPDISVQTSKRNYIFKRLGYSIHPHRVKIHGKSRRIWSKSPITNEQIHDHFKK